MLKKGPIFTNCLQKDSYSVINSTTVSCQSFRVLTKVLFRNKMLQQHIPMLQLHIPMLKHILVLKQLMLALQQNICAAVNLNLTQPGIWAELGDFVCNAISFIFQVFIYILFLSLRLNGLFGLDAQYVIEQSQCKFVSSK